MARKCFYVCAGMLMLALSFHFGFTTAAAQAPGNPVVAVVTSNYQSGMMYAFTADGTVYQGQEGTNWTLRGHVVGGPVPTQQETWGQVKSRYAPNRGMQPGAQGR